MTPAEEERAAVVAFIRRIAAERYSFGDDDGDGLLSWVADDIEAREHLKEQPE